MRTAVLFRTADAGAETLARFRAVRGALYEHDVVVAWDGTAGPCPAGRFDGAPVFQLGRAVRPDSVTRLGPYAPGHDWWERHWCTLEHALTLGGYDAYWVVDGDAGAGTGGAAGSRHVLHAHESWSVDSETAYLGVSLHCYADLELAVEPAEFAPPSMRSEVLLLAANLSLAARRAA